MTAPTAASPAAPRWRMDPGYVVAQTLDGRPYIAKDSEPYTQFWLDERERLLLALFAARRGSTEEAATLAWLRLSGNADTPAERQRVGRAVRVMQRAGVVVPLHQDTSRYSQDIAADYVAHRPFPAELAAHIVQQGRVQPHSRVLDLAGGPGDLALALARRSQHVSLMELSRGFLQTATRRAREQGLALNTHHESCNRLAQHDAMQDVITVSQALHWLDDVAVCRGVCRLLQPDGSFFVVHSVMDVPDEHPLAYLLGHDSILGAKARRPFAEEVQALHRRLALLFDALDAPDVDRIDPLHVRSSSGDAGQRIRSASVALFRQQRTFGPGYARGFLTPQHIAVTGQKPAAFWRTLHARCAQARPVEFIGHHHWAVLHFQRGAPLTADVPMDTLPVQDIGYEGLPDC